MVDAEQKAVGLAIQRLYNNDPRKEEADADMELVASYISKLKNQLKTAQDRCYVLPDGECVSPFDCVHGPGINMEALIADRAYMNWLSDHLVYASVKVIGYHAENLANNGKGWAADELRMAISRAIERQNEYQAKLDKK